jgi:hypothetical protein
MASPSIEYQKVMSEVVFINLPAPTEPTPGMSGMEILHGFLAEFYQTTNEEIKSFTNAMCLKWNVHYREQKPK